jgi:predicted transposase/invertase (TIGR01784 family)
MVLHLDKKEHRNMQQRSREPSLSLFIPGTNILRPVIDVISKTLLEQNKEVLISLLTAVLSPQSPIEEVTILNPELRNGPSHDDKLSHLDMLVLLNDGQLINIEFQTGNQVHFVRRALFYLIQTGIGELKAGEDYGRLPNLTGIYIFNDIFRDDVPDVHLVYEPTRVKPGDGACLQQGLLRMDFIQLATSTNFSFVSKNRGFQVIQDYWMR